MIFELSHSRAVFTIALLFSIMSSAISRVGGGGIESETSNFKTEIPAQFQGGNLASTEGSGINTNELLLRDVIKIGINAQISQILMAEFQIRFPSWVEQDPANFANFLAQQGFQVMSVPKIPCAQGWYLSTPAQNGKSAAEHMVIRIGPAQGVAIDGTANGDVLSALKGVQESIELIQGTCSWK